VFWRHSTQKTPIFAVKIFSFRMQPLDVISSAHPAYIESLYLDYQKAPEGVSREWRNFFKGFDLAMQSSANGTTGPVNAKEFAVYALIDGYRRKGHLLSRTNPIRERKDRKAGLELGNFGLSDADLDTAFEAGTILGMGQARLRDIIDRLKAIYCRSLGFEYMYITEEKEQQWLQERIEAPAGQIDLTLDEKKQVLKKLNGSNVFEEFLSIKYIGQKRFSLEGGESTIPALDTAIEEAANTGVEEVVIGMAHRGRLNVLVNILGKTYEQIFSEFEGKSDPDLTMGDGDVKYHLGYSSIIPTRSGKKVNIKVAPNPSHLEAVTPVVLGYVRAKGDLIYNSEFHRILPIIIHGDAAIAGQGVVYEVAQMSQLRGFRTWGTLHFVINNQIGFTTDFDDARSSHYCTSVAASVQAPVIHVNGDDVEAVVFAMKLAVAYLQEFHKDVYVDMVCYRKHGHNEGDDPKFTQPALYAIIDKHPNPREIYLEQLIERGKIERELANQMNEEFKQMMENALAMVKQKPLPYQYQEPELEWKKLRRSTPEDFEKSPNTAITKKQLHDLAERIISVPEGFNTQRKVLKMLEKRRQVFFDTGQLDWASAELLAYASMLAEGHNIRISGQDSIRGTFSHRHAILYEEKTSEQYNRLDNLFKNQDARFRVHNSLLSEYAVLGFEYGYALASPSSLVLWEAQFGDFANGAQVMIDQFISSSESKWQRMNGIVMLLPHGYEGQGPEHSSARLERFLQLSAEFNMIVANITTPANFFHLLRRQLAWPFRKPLVVMSPKSLLRHPKCVSETEDFTKGGFQEILVDDWSSGKPAGVKKVVFCSGKIYYDLLERQEEARRNDLIIVRLEQLYPLPFKQIDAVMDKYPKARKIWLQEEPANMGAWVYMLSCYRNANWEVVSRKSSASPASGYQRVHMKEQKALIDKVFE
jgi:2-oxoglutarate dehydrogenase E1 component